MSHHRTAERKLIGKLVTRLTGARPILMYHGVGQVEEDPFGLFVSPETFAHQMRVLNLMGLQGVSLGQFGDAIEQGRGDGLVGLTFDDGYRDVLTWVPPVLEKYGFTATMFAVSRLTGGENVWDPPPRRPLMSQDDLRDLASRGWEVGSHTLTHARLTEVAPERASHEISASRVALADVTGTAPRSFCYPYGSVNEEAVNAVRHAGYTYGCAVWRVDGLPATLAMPRIGMTERDRGLRFAAKLFLRGR